MDSSKDSVPLKNTVRVGGDGDKNKERKTVPSQPEVGDSAVSLFTTTNHLTAFVSQNGPRVRPMNPIVGDAHQHTSNYNENSEPNVKACVSQSNMCHNKVASSGTDQADSPAAGGSKILSNTSDNGTESNSDVQSCQKHKCCIDKSNKSLPSTSGTSRSSENPESSGVRESRKRPSSLKLNRSNLDEDSSSDTGNDDYSLGSEDGCIYTYRGGEHLADLPSSFFSLDMGLPLDNHLPLPNYPVQQQGGRDSRASSPDMDFLEMDFDPGPSCEVDTGDESSPDADLEAVGNMPEENEPVMQGRSPEHVPPILYNTMSATASTSASLPDTHTYSIPSTHTFSTSSTFTYGIPSTSREVIRHEDPAETASACFSYGPYITHVNTRGEQLVVRRTTSHGAVNIHPNTYVGNLLRLMQSGVLDYNEEYLDGLYTINQAHLDCTKLSSSLYHLSMAKRLMAEKNKLDSDNQGAAKPSDSSATPSTSTSGVSCVEPPRVMIWSESEACERQVTQIGTSACGATAIVNVFIALGVPVNLEKINTSVGTRQRANNAPIPRYLLSRAVAGCTAAELVTGIHRASDGLVTARFFPTYPERVVSLSHWLADWITLGAVPILTLNLQAGFELEVPDAWHHQMVFGVSPRGVFLSNPVECVREATLWPRLTSPSILLVRTSDILSRFTKETDLTPLMAVPDRRFHTFNVLGQVVNVIRESAYGTRTRHVRIPASYQAGVTVAALTGSEAHRRLMAAPQLPVMAHTHPT